MKNLAFIIAIIFTAAPFARAADRPNILFILADNWRYPTAGILGDPMAKTPAFDRIAREGILFTHTFQSCPIVFTDSFVFANWQKST